jgi:hypothetical protein
VKNLSVDQVELRTATDDMRPVAILDCVEGASLNRVKFPSSGGAGGLARLVVKNVRGLTIRSSAGLPETTQANGEKIAEEKF